jgi:hypothetical protein
MKAAMARKRRTTMKRITQKAHGSRAIASDNVEALEIAIIAATRAAHWLNVKPEKFLELCEAATASTGRKNSNFVYGDCAYRKGPAELELRTEWELRPFAVTAAEMARWIGLKPKQFLERCEAAVELEKTIILTGSDGKEIRV